jgi:hypothetical protein
MALGEIPPWLNVQPSDFVRAGSAGAEAGLGAAKVALEAKAQSDQAALQAARLSQAERIANMEMQARREIAEQNRLREDQQLAIQSAYHTAQIGVAKDRIAEQQALAEAKGRAAANQMARNAGFAEYIKAHPEDMIGGYAQFGPESNVVNALRMTQPTPPGQATIVTHPETGKRKFLRQGRSGQETPITEPSEEMTISQEMTKQSKIDAWERERDKVGILPKSQRPAAMKKIDDAIAVWKNFGTKSKFSRYDASSGKLVPVDLSLEPPHDEGQ